MQDLIAVQHRNSAERQEKRQVMSKSVIGSRKTEHEKLVDSEIPAISADLGAGNNDCSNELVS